DAGGQGGDPVAPLRQQPVGLLDPRAVGQAPLPVALPMLLGRALPAGQDQVADCFTAHVGASSIEWRQCRRAMFQLKKNKNSFTYSINGKPLVSSSYIKKPYKCS